MIAVYVAAVTHTSLDVIERWSPEKLLAYLPKATEVHKIMRS